MNDQERKDYPYLNPHTGRFWGDTIDKEGLESEIKKLEELEKEHCKVYNVGPIELRYPIE